MTISDYPDYAKPPPLTNVGIDSWNGTIVGTKSTGPYVLFGYDSVAFTFQNLDNNTYYHFQLVFQSNFNGNQSGIIKDFIVGPSDSGTFVLPALRQLLNLNVTIISGAGTNGLDWYLSGYTYTVSNYGSYCGLPLINSFSGSVVANTFDLIPPSQWYSGDVVVIASVSGNTPANLQFNYYDLTALAFVQFAVVQAVNGANLTPIRLTYPPAPVQLRANNGSTTQTFNIWVTPANTTGQ